MKWRNGMSISQYRKASMQTQRLNAAKISMKISGIYRPISSGVASAWRRNVSLVISGKYDYRRSNAWRQSLIAVKKVCRYGNRSLWLASSKLTKEVTYLKITVILSAGNG